MNFGPTLANVQKDLSLIEMEKVILVSLKNNENELFYYKLNEMKSLCEACNFEINETIYQALDKPNTKTYIGSGKLKEVKMVADLSDIKIVVFDQELTPSQIKNINEVLTDIEVIDRTMLILQIFSKRATSKIGQLQVEIARAKYLLPRLIGARSYLSRVGGGSSGGATNRGSGETKLELDRRYLESRINQLKKELEYYKEQRKTTRKLRNESGAKKIAFVGYTNAGKSSTINSLLALYGLDKKELFVKDMLFATLETQTRKIKLPNNHEFLITDTIGFVSDLPHHLVESFKSTLEEILEADIIVHIVDASSPFKDLQMETTISVLNSIGVDNIPIITVFNKCDLVKNPYLLNQYTDVERISAKFKEGLRILIDKIDELTFGQSFIDTYLIPFNDSKYVNLLKTTSEVYDISFSENGTIIKAKVSLQIHQMLEKYIFNE